MTPAAVRATERRRAIALAATRGIVELGYERFSVNALADELGISVGGLYRYIKTKSDLLVMACEDIYGGLLERIVDAVAGQQSTAQKLSAALGLYLQSCADNRRQILLMYREYRHLPVDAGDRYRERELAIADCFAELLESAIGQGLIPELDAALLAQDIILMGHLPALKGWALRDRVDPQRLIEGQISLLLRGLGVG